MLPENTDSFTALVSLPAALPAVSLTRHPTNVRQVERGTATAWATLQEKWPVADRRLAKTLVSTLSALTHW
jgi:hypothetical protein